MPSNIPSVNDQSSTESNKERIGKVFVVDPNPPGMEQIPPEDLFIYVNFSAYPRSKTTYGGTLEGDAVLFDSGVEDEVNFISTKISYKEGKLDPNPQKTYATTDWTEIGGFKRSDTRSSGILEGFGIKSIDIKYDASLVPVVDITFTDVRGSALFDVIESDDRKTPYSLFFKMPYPVFKLSIKGYFGNKVDYCLHMVNWTSNFDGSTGNFDISANFLGFQQAFLNDMVIGNIIATNNTSRGRANLDKIYNKRIQEGKNSIPNDNGEDLRQIDDFLTKIAKIQIDSENIKSDNKNFDVLKSLNGKLKLLKDIKGFIGGAIQKQSKKGNSDNKTQEEYLKRENRVNYFDTNPINDDELKIKENYLSIRDFIVFKSINIDAFKSFIFTLSDIINKYEEYVKGIGGKKYVSPTNSVEDEKNKTLNKLTDGLQETYDDEIFKSFQRTDVNKNWENYIIFTKDTNDKPKSRKLSDVINAFINGVENINIKLTTNYVDGPDINNGIDLSGFTKEVLINGQNGGKYYKNPYKFKEDTNVFVADFRKQRAVIEDAIQQLEESIKVLRDKVQLELNEEIFANFEKQFKFRPTVDKCFEILANNTQAMVETIWDISDEAEKIGEARKSDLRNYETDIVDGAKEVAWQSVYSIGSDNSLKEIYIGEAGVNVNNFPELTFVEEVYKILVAKRKSLEETTRSSILKNGQDTDNWFPLNPIDYKINPWIKLNSLQTEKEIGNELVKNIFLRLALLKNYSRFSTTTGLDSLFAPYGNLESIAMNKTIVSETTRKIIGNLLPSIKDQLSSSLSNSTDDKKFNLVNSDFWKDYVDSSGNNYIIKENLNVEIGGFKISGNYNGDADYILFDDKDIINNSKKLFTEIKEDETYRDKIKDQIKNNISIYGQSSQKPYVYKNIYVNNNLNTYNAYNVWDEDVMVNILNNKKEVTDNLNGVPLTTFNPSGNSINSKFLNNPYFDKNFTPSSGCSFGDTLISSNLYQQQNSNYARALLLLSTFPFRKFEDSFLKSVFGDKKVFDGARIVNIPITYVYYLGGLLMRYENQFTIDFNMNASGCSSNYTIFDSGKDRYINLGYHRYLNTGNTSSVLENELISLPSSVKNTLINKFKIWVDQGNFNNTKNGFLELKMKRMVPSKNDLPTSTQDIQLAEKQILDLLNKTTNLIILNPNIFDPNRNNSGLTVPKTEIESYLDIIIKKFGVIENERDLIPEPKTDEEIKKATLEKLQIYNYFKNINNKWVGGDRRAFNICGGGDKDLIEYFKFIDRGWRNIGSEATFNLKSFLTLGSNLNTSVYFFMSKLLRDSNFLFQILPTYIDYKDSKEVAKMFQPQTQLEVNSQTGPIFCCIYVGGASEVLDIGERNNYYFKNDGFSFPNPNDPNDKGDLPPDMVSPDDSSLVAFRVAFGAQNQVIFKNVSLSQQEHKETGEYFKALGDLVDKRGGTQKTYVGTDLLRLFKTRSYTCKVDALGCMNIQPLMYFDLQNVPFFNGAYLVTSVNHNISPNHMTTNFQGVRQSKFISPPSNKITAELDLDLNEINDIPKLEFFNLNNKDNLFKIGVLNPTERFDFETNFGTEGGGFTRGISKFKEIGITQFTDEKLKNIINYLNITLPKNKIETNSQVTTFISAMLSNSNNLSNKEMPWELDNNEEPVKDGSNTLYYGLTKNSKYVTAGDPLYDPIIDAQQDTYLSSIPLFTAGTTNDIAYAPKGNNELDESGVNDKINEDKTNLTKKINSITGTSATDVQNKQKLEKEYKKLEDKEKELYKYTNYYNIFKGDAYRFRPRGYLYLIGRKQYYEISGYKSIENPFLVNDTERNAILTSINVWKGISGGTSDTKTKTAYEFSNLGTAASYGFCIDISHQYKGSDKESSFNTFENVLNVFTLKDGTPLIDYNNP